MVCSSLISLVLHTEPLVLDAKETKVLVQQIANEMSSRDCEYHNFNGNTCISSQMILGERILQDLQRWLTPPDPSTNHDIAYSSQHERTAVWVFNENIYQEWESSGALLWLHGKGLSLCSRVDISRDDSSRSGLGKEHPLVCHPTISVYRSLCPLSSISSAIIEHLITLRKAGLATVAYYYFDFRDVDKKHRRGLLSSLLLQLSSRSVPCFDILSRLYSSYNDGKERPSERALVQCLKELIAVVSMSQLPTYIILDAVDECPNTSGIPTPREQVLELVKDLIDLGLPNLHICVTSRPEIDISTSLEPLASGRLSLHDQPGQKKDIDEYVSSVVQSDTRMRRWREDDRKLVIETLSEKADGM